MPFSPWLLKSPEPKGPAKARLCALFLLDIALGLYSAKAKL